ncbi:MAG: hypothetical protein ACXW3X_16860, partial [Rhodoplanes sp.]
MVVEIPCRETYPSADPSPQGGAEQRASPADLGPSAHSRSSSLSHMETWFGKWQHAGTKAHSMSKVFIGASGWT